MGKNRNKKKTTRKLKVANSQVSNHSPSNGKPPEDGRSSGQTSRIKHQGDSEKNLRETSEGTVFDSSRPPAHSSNNKSKRPKDGKTSGRKSWIKQQGVREKNLSETSGGTVLDSLRSTAHSSNNKSKSSQDAESFEQKRNVPVIPRGKDTLLLLGFSDLEISSLSQEGISIPCVQDSKGKVSRLEMVKMLGTENALDEPKVIGYTDSPIQTLEPVCYEKNPVNAIRNISFGETREQKPHSSISGCSLNTKPDARDQMYAESSNPNCARDNKSRAYSSIVKSRAFVKGTFESNAANADFRTVEPNSSDGTGLTRTTESNSFRQTENNPSSIDGYTICGEEISEYTLNRVESPCSVSSLVDNIEDNRSNSLTDPYFEAKDHAQVTEKFKRSVPQPRTDLKKGYALNNGNLEKSLDTNQKKTNWELEKFTGAREKSKFSSSKSIAQTKKPLDGDNVYKHQVNKIHGKQYVTPKYGNEIKGNSNRRTEFHKDYSKKCFEEEVHKWLSVRYKSIQKLEKLLLTASQNGRACDNMQLNCKYGSVACRQSKIMDSTWTWEFATSLGSLVCDVAGGLTSVIQMVSTDAIQSQFQQIMDADEVATKKMYEARSKYATEYRYTVEITRKFGGTTLGETLCKISEAVGITEFFKQIKKANDNREDIVEATITAIGSVINRNCNREVGREVIDAVQGLVESNPACVGTVAGIGKSLYGAADLRMIPIKRSGQVGALVKAGTAIVDMALLEQEQNDILALERKMSCGSKSKVEKDIQEALNMLIQEKEEMVKKFSINYRAVAEKDILMLNGIVQ